MGIAKRLQGTSQGAALALGMIERIRRHYSKLGYRHGELSWVLEDNRRGAGGDRGHRRGALQALPDLREGAGVTAGAIVLARWSWPAAAAARQDPVARYRKVTPQVPGDRRWRADAGAGRACPGRLPAHRHHPGLARRPGAARPVAGAERRCVRPGRSARCPAPPSLSRSVEAAFDDAGAPLLVTTADHALLVRPCSSTS